MDCLEETEDENLKELSPPARCEWGISPRVTARKMTIHRLNLFVQSQQQPRETEQTAKPNVNFSLGTREPVAKKLEHLQDRSYW
jgi:hypothetical protein